MVSTWFCYMHSTCTPLQGDKGCGQPLPYKPVVYKPNCCAHAAAIHRGGSAGLLWFLMVQTRHCTAIAGGRCGPLWKAGADAEAGIEPACPCDWEKGTKNQSRPSKQAGRSQIYRWIYPSAGAGVAVGPSMARLSISRNM